MSFLSVILAALEQTKVEIWVIESFVTKILWRGDEKIMGVKKKEKKVEIFYES